MDSLNGGVVEAQNGAVEGLYSVDQWYQIRIRYHFDADPDPYYSDADPTL